MNRKGTDEEDHDKIISEYLYQSHFILISVVMRSELVIDYSYLQMFPQAHSFSAHLLQTLTKEEITRDTSKCHQVYQMLWTFLVIALLLCPSQYQFSSGHKHLLCTLCMAIDDTITIC